MDGFVDGMDDGRFFSPFGFALPNPIITTQPSSHQHQHQHQQRHQERREPLSFINPIHIRNHSITEYPDDRKDEDYFCLDYFAASQCIFADEYEIWTVV